MWVAEETADTLYLASVMVHWLVVASYSILVVSCPTSSMLVGSPGSCTGV